MYTQHYLPKLGEACRVHAGALSRLMSKHCEDPETSYTTLPDPL